MFNFETHLTVKCNLDEVGDFSAICSAIGAKVIIINLKDGENQVMTSKTQKAAKLDYIIEELERDTKVLENFGFKVIRKKVESEPRYVQYIHKEYEHIISRKVYHYFEIHVPCHSDLLTEENMSILTMRWHKSRNEFKSGVTMLTCRDVDENLIDMIDYDIKAMQSKGMVTEKFKHHYEYAVMDTNSDLDKKWMS